MYYKYCWIYITVFSSGSRGPWGHRPPLPPIFKASDYILRPKLQVFSGQIRVGPPWPNPGSVAEYYTKFYLCMTTGHLSTEENVGNLSKTTTQHGVLFSRCWLKRIWTKTSMFLDWRLMFEFCSRALSCAVPNFGLVVWLFTCRSSHDIFVIKISRLFAFPRIVKDLL